jgi:hypothetical protein
MACQDFAERMQSRSILSGEAARELSFSNATLVEPRRISLPSLNPARVYLSARGNDTLVTRMVEGRRVSLGGHRSRRGSVRSKW